MGINRRDEIGMSDHELLYNVQLERIFTGPQQTLRRVG